MDYDLAHSLVSEAVVTFNLEMIRCEDIYRLNHLLKMLVQNLERIQAGVQIELDELEGLDNG